jgi:hypothetical protein
MGGRRLEHLRCGRKSCADLIETMAASEDGQLLSESEILRGQVTMPTEGGEERRDAGD